MGGGKKASIPEVRLKKIKCNCIDCKCGTSQVVEQAISNKDLQQSHLFRNPTDGIYVSSYRVDYIKRKGDANNTIDPSLYKSHFALSTDNSVDYLTHHDDNFNGKQGEKAQPTYNRTSMMKSNVSLNISDCIGDFHSHHEITSTDVPVKRSTSLRIYH
jgi:hypothetical protein